MGSTLTGQKIKDTYLGFIKTSDSLEVNASGKELTDGNGNDLDIFINTGGQLGFSSTPDFTIDAGGNTDAFRLPNGSTAQQPTGQSGIIRYNTTDSKLEYFDTSYKFIASENYVNTQINNLIDSSPAALDTLNEIAAALNDDPDFYNTINTLINTKQDTVTGAATTIVSSDLTVSRALISNASGKVAVSSVTDTELGYVSGVTSDIQTQIDAKYDKTGGTISGNATITGDLTVDTNTLYVNSTNNRVGIGATIPETFLHIDASGTPSNNVPLKIESGAATSFMHFRDANTTADFKVRLGSSGDNLLMYAGGSERVRITSSGDVSFRDTSNNEAFYWDASASSLGIGTDSPSSFSNYSTLTVNGTNGGIINLKVAETETGRLQVFSGAFNIAAKGASTSLLFETNGAERMRITSGGDISFRDTSLNEAFYWDASAAYLGIGTDLPARELEVQGSGNVYIRVAASTDNDSSAIELQNTQETWTIKNDDTNNDAFEIDSSTTGNIVTIEKTGNVGIGTDSPAEKLTISDSGQAKARLLSTDNSGVRFDLHSSGGGRYSLQALANSEFLIFDEANGQYAARYGAGSSGSWRFFTNNSERMKITSGGDISFRDTSNNEAFYWDASTASLGIGTGSNPSRKLSIYDTSSIPVRIETNTSDTKIEIITTSGTQYVQGSANNLLFGTNNTERIRIDSSGRVGIGTASPFTNLTVYGATDSRIALINSNSGTTSSDGFVMILEDDSEVNFLNRESAAIKFATAGIERMRIDSSGRVGIGVTPNAWSSPNFTVLQLGVGASIAGRGSAGIGDQVYISANTYYDGTTWRYIETNPASNYYQDNGEHVWRTAVNGSAGVPTTLSERMRITSGGEVQATNSIKSPIFYSNSGSFTSSAGNWVNVVLLEQSEFRNRTIIASAYVNGTHTYASATVNVIHNGGSYVIALGNKLGTSGADLRISSGYLQFYNASWSANSLYRLTVN